MTDVKFFCLMCKYPQFKFAFLLMRKKGLGLISIVFGLPTLQMNLKKLVMMHFPPTRVEYLPMPPHIPILWLI